MSSKSDNFKNDGQEDADQSLKTEKAPNAHDRSQVTMNFGQEEADKLTEEKFKEWAEAEMKKRAQEGQRLGEQIEAKEVKLVEEAQAKEKAQEKQRLEEDAAVKRKVEHELKSKDEAEDDIRAENKFILKEGPEVIKSADEVLKEKAEAQAKKRAEDEKIQKDNAEVQRIIQEEERRKAEAETKSRIQEEQQRKAEAETKSRIQEERHRKAEAEAIRKAQSKDSIKKARETVNLRDEEWRKFKEEADAKRHSRSGNQPESIVERTEGIEGRRKPEDKNRKRRVVVIGSIAALAILALWIFSLSNEGSEEQTPGFQDKNAITEDNSVTPTSESAATIQQNSPSNREIGETFEGGMIFTIVPSGRTGKVAYSKDLGPMSWKEAMNIHEQLGEGWRLPTMNELGTMRRNIGQGADNSGKFSDELYWSATPYDANQARLLRFGDGDTSFHFNNSLSTRRYLVRAVRDFSR